MGGEGKGGGKPFFLFAGPGGVVSKREKRGKNRLQAGRAKRRRKEKRKVLIFRLLRFSPRLKEGERKRIDGAREERKRRLLNKLLCGEERKEKKKRVL